MSIFKIRYLLLFLLVLMFLLAGNHYWWGDDRDTTLPMDIVKIDTAKLQEISIAPEMDFNRAVRLVKRNHKWKVKIEEGYLADTDPDIMNRSLGHLENFRPAGLEALRETDYERFGLDEKGTFLKLKHNDNREVSLVLGDFIFRDEAQAITPFRIPGDDRVFSIDLYFEASLKETEVNQWRNRTLFESEHEEISGLAVHLTDTIKYILKRSSTGWEWDRETSLNKGFFQQWLINAISFIYEEDFVDIETIKELDPPVAELTIKTQDRSTVRIKGFIKDGMYITSSTASRGNFFYVSEERFMELFPAPEVFE